MMLTSTLRSLAAGTAVLALSAWGISALVQNDSTYTPRPEASVAQPDGAMDIRRMMQGWSFREALNHSRRPEGVVEG